MAEQTYDRQALALLKGRAACKLAEIHQMLAPGIAAPYSLSELQERAMRHMQSLPPVEREKLRLRAVVAYAELERLGAQMAQQLHYLSQEISRVSRHKRANLAYRQLPRPQGLRAAGI